MFCVVLFNVGLLSRGKGSMDVVSELQRPLWLGYVTLRVSLEKKVEVGTQQITTLSCWCRWSGEVSAERAPSALLLPLIYLSRLLMCLQRARECARLHVFTASLSSRVSLSSYFCQGRVLAAGINLMLPVLGSLLFTKFYPIPDILRLPFVALQVRVSQKSFINK